MTDTTTTTTPERVPASRLRAVFTDMDGTLLDPHHRLTPRTLEAVRRMRARGILFVVATGRPHADVFATLDAATGGAAPSDSAGEKEAAEGLPVDFYITCNGARVHDGRRALVAEHNLDPALVAELVGITRQPRADGTLDASGGGPKRFATNVYQGERWLGDRIFPDIVPGFAAGFTQQQTVGGRPLCELTTRELQGCQQVWFQAPRADLEPLHALLQGPRFAGRLSAAYTLPTIIDCVPPGVNKGAAMAEVARLLGLADPRAEVAAFGDGANDLPMLRGAARAFVMANAHDSVKAAAPPHAEFIGSNADDGVARKLEELFLSRGRGGGDSQHNSATDGGEGGAEWHRQALERAARESAELCEEEEKLRALLERLNGHLSSAVETKEETKRELESCRRQLGTAGETHEAELQALTEKMAAAARFSEREWREHYDRVEAEGRRLRGVAECATSSSLALLLQVEEATRRRLQDEEAATRPPATRVEMYRDFVRIAEDVETSGSEEDISAGAEKQIQFLCLALGCTREELHDKYVRIKTAQYGSVSVYDNRAQGRSAWELYLALCDVGFPTDAAFTKMFGQEAETYSFYFSAVGHKPDFGIHSHSIPCIAAYDLSHRLLRHVPKLKYLHFSHLPPLSAPGALEALADSRRILESLELRHTDYTIADLFALRERCPALNSLWVHASRCTDWGKYADIADMKNRKAKLEKALQMKLLFSKESE